MVEILSTNIVVRVVGVYVALVFFNDINVMFVNELETYYTLTSKFIIDTERLRMSRS